MEESQIQDVKDRLDIVEVISSYLTLKKAGTNYKANCPFHNEKSPSLMISPERQTFKCFGCSEGGDVISFVEKIEGLDFYNALKLLASRAGVELKVNSINSGNKEYSSDKKTKVFEINEWAKKVYHYVLLNDKKAEKARQYLEGRGLTEETIKKFEIGYAPDSWDFMLNYLLKKNYTQEEILEAGIVTRSERGKYFDRFRGRIMFPISNIIGNTIAFTSRIIIDSSDQAKYINSAESSIYIKGKTIYGLDKAKLAIKEENLAIMVEGNMDVIACHQAGFRNVVATSGTALTLDQLKILTRYAETIAFCFDSDNAGQTAMKRAIRMALQNDISIKVFSTAPAKDPDELIKKDPEQFRKLIKDAKPALEYWIEKLVGKGDLSIDDKKKISKEILPEIKNISSDIEKEHYIKFLAERIDIKQEAIINALTKSKDDKEFKKAEQTINLTKKKLTIVEKILGLIWADHTLVAHIAGELKDLKEDDELLLPLFQMINAGQIEPEKLDSKISNFYDQLSIEVLQDVDPTVDNALSSELQYLLGRLRSDKKESLKDNFAKKIKEAERKGDKEALKQLLAEFSSLIK